MGSMPPPKKKRIGRRRNPGIETMTAGETEVSCLFSVLLPSSIQTSKPFFSCYKNFYNNTQ